MKEYLENKKITKKFIRLDLFLIFTGILTLIIGLLSIEIISTRTYKGLSILFHILILIIIGIIENNIKNKY